MKHEFKELFLSNKPIVVSDTETTGLYYKTENEISAPEMTQISGIEYSLAKKLDVKQDNGLLTVSFNGFVETFEIETFYEDSFCLKNGTTIEFINDIPLLVSDSGEKQLLFKDSLFLEEKEVFSKIFNTKNNIDFIASAVTMIVNREKLINMTDSEKASFLLANFNRLRGKLDSLVSSDIRQKWEKIVEENNLSKTSTLLPQFLNDFHYFDVSEKDENGNYIYPFLEEKEKEEILSFFEGKVLAGHNFAGFDYANVLKGNGIDPKEFIIDTMNFEQKKGKGNSLDVNILHYLESDLLSLKESILKLNNKKYSKDLVDKISTLAKKIKDGGVKSLNEEINNFDDNELAVFVDTSLSTDESNVKTKMVYLKELIDLINKRIFAHDAELDVRLNKYVLERKMNIYFDKTINTVDLKEKAKGLEIIETESVIVPKGIMGIRTKDTDGNITKFGDLLAHFDTLPYKNYVISDSNPKNYYELNKKLKEGGYKNTLSLQMVYLDGDVAYPIDVMIPSDKTNLLLSFITETRKSFILTKENIEDLLKFSDARIVMSLALKDVVREINNEKLKIGIDITSLPSVSDIKEVEDIAVFTANNSYGKGGKILSDVIWHSITENEKISIQNLINLQNENEEILDERSITSVDEKYLNSLYVHFPKIGENSNSMLEELESFLPIEPVIYDKKNIFLTPKKLGLTDKEFETTDEYKQWTFENIQKNISFTKTLAPYITALQKYIEGKKEELHTSDRDTHLKLLKENTSFYNKIINEYNSKNLTTIVDKFQFIDYLLKNTDDFEEYLQRTLSDYNDRITTELDVIFDMPGKGISNGHNLFTTQAVVNTMNDLLSESKNKIEIPEELQFTADGMCYSENYNEVIQKMLDGKNTEKIYELITKEQNKRTVGPGRGSAAGSLVTYNLDITDLDPIRFGLLFERFLNPERISPPDIDNDYPFSDNPKGLTIYKFLDMLEEKYGFTKDDLYQWLENYGLEKEMFDKYAQNYKMVKKLGTEVEATGKSVFRRLLSVMGVPPLRVNDYSKTYDGDLTLLENIKKKEELYNIYAILKDLDLDKLEGLSMNTGTAASAVMLNFIAPTDNGKTMAFNKNSDGIFDNKLDILSLSTMKLILLMQRQMIKNGDILFNYSIDDLDDKETLLNIQNGRTGVVFQIESSLMTNAVKDLYPLDYQAIADTSAIQRPGPAEWAAAPYLINRRMYYKNYFLKLVNKDILEKSENGELSVKDIDDLYEKIKNSNSYIVVDKNDLSKGHMLSKDQFRTIMTTRPFLESGEFFQIAGLHTKNLISAEIKGMSLKSIKNIEDFYSFKEMYEEQNKGLTSIETVYLKAYEEAFATIPDKTEKIGMYLHKEADKKTVSTLKEFEVNLTKNKLYKEITDKTFGTLVYQEDIMLLVQKLGGFTIGAADILRRAISKKGYDLSGVKSQIIDNLSNQVTLFETESVKFYKGPRNHLMFKDVDGKEYNLGDTYIKDKGDGTYWLKFTTNKLYLNNLPKEIKEKLNFLENLEETFGKLKPNGYKNIENFSELEATYLYDKMKSFAGYAFNKSHADSYTNITYITAYIKTHQPNIFYNTILRNGSLSNAQNLLREINVHDLKMVIPMVNDIDLNNSTDIIFPVSKIKSVNTDIELAVNHLKENVLEKGERIEDITFLYRNLTKKYLNKTTMTNLSKFGFFNDLMLPMKEKTLNNYIDVVLKTLEENEVNMKNYFMDSVLKTSGDLGLKVSKAEVKTMVTKYFANKKILLEYQVEQQRNKHFEFNALELDIPSNKVFKEVELFEKNYPEICKAYLGNTSVGEYDFGIDKELFFDTFKENLTKGLSDSEKETKLTELSDKIEHDNEFNEIEKQLLYTDLLKEYNFKENVVRVKTCDRKEVEKCVKDFQKEFVQIYKDKKNDSGEEARPVVFNDTFIGETPKTLILVPNYTKTINESEFNGNKKSTPKLVVNGELTVFEDRDIEKDKHYINNYGTLMTKKKNIHRLYIKGTEEVSLDTEYSDIEDIECEINDMDSENEENEVKDTRDYYDFVVQSNGIFYIGGKNTETFINEQGFPSLEPLFDGKGILKNHELAEELGIKTVKHDTRKFNKIMEDLIKMGVNLNDVVIMPSSGKTDGEKIDWVGNANYLKTLQKLVKDSKLRSVIPIGNEALKSIKSLNNITFAGFKTDFNYPYQFGDKLGYVIVTFVENRFAPGFERKNKIYGDYVSTMKKILKDEIVVDEKGIFENTFKKAKKEVDASDLGSTLVV